jgi:glutaredoxin
MILVYSLPVCPNCDELKHLFELKNINYKSLDLEDPDVYAELLLDGVTLVEAPIVKINDQYFDKTSAMKELGIC